MAEGSAFDKRHVEETEVNDLGGLLEQLNLPPAVVTFIRANIRLVQVVTAIVIITVVAWALYGSYKEKKIQSAATSLALALEDEGPGRLDALYAVENNFSGTASALWAKIASARELVKSDKVQEAKQRYIEVRSELGKTSPLLPLIVVGIAQTSEISGEYQEATAEYTILKTTKGYEELGFTGLARIQELQGEKEKALQIYEEYIATLQDGGSGAQKTLVEEKIARIRASL